MISHLLQTGAPANEVSAEPFLPTAPTVFVAGQNRWAGGAPSPCQRGGGSLSECGHAGGRLQVWETGEGSTRGQGNHPKSERDLDWGRPDSRSSQAIAFAPELSPQVQIQTLSSDLKCEGEGRMRGSGHLPRILLCILYREA